MARSIQSLSLVMLLLLGCLGLFALACSEDSDGDDDDNPQSCQENADCGVGNLCNASNLCQACTTTCETLADCDATTQVCDTTIGCCIDVSCGEDDDCEDTAQYCIDKMCREKSCTEDSDCTRAGNLCLDDVCKHPECTEYSQCETNVCNLETYTCESCSLDSDCPQNSGLICSSGNCVTPGSDDDDDENLLGCQEFQDSCLFDLFNCYGEKHLDPLMDVQGGGCSLLCEDGNAAGYRYTLTDGAVWENHVTESGFYGLAIKADGTTCYKVEPDIVSMVYYIFYDANDTEVGRYQVNEAEGFVEIRCADGQNSKYRFDELYQGTSGHCQGFSRNVRYAPPSQPDCPTECP